MRTDNSHIEATAERARSPGGRRFPSGGRGAATLAVGVRVQLALLAGGARTWTVIDGEYRSVRPVEEYLDYLRVLGRSPNTVKSYARALALWWQFLGAYDVAWDEIRLEDFGRFLAWLRSGDTPQLASIEPRAPSRTFKPMLEHYWPNVGLRTPIMHSALMRERPARLGGRHPTSRRPADREARQGSLSRGRKRAMTGPCDQL